MKYQKTINLLDNTPNQPTKFRTKHWFEINDESRGTYNTNSQIVFKTSMLRTSLCDYNDVYILVKGTITVANAAAARADANNANKKVIFNICSPFTSCISRINNTKIDNSQYNDAVMPMYNLIEYSNIYSEASGILFQYCRDIPAIDNNRAVTGFTEANATTDLFKLEVKLTGKTGYTGIENVEIMVPLKYHCNFWRTLEIPLINCEITVDLD